MEFISSLSSSFFLLLVPFQLLTFFAPYGV